MKGPIRHVFTHYQRPDLAVGDFRLCPQCGGALAVDGEHAPPRLRCGDCQWIHYRNPSPGVTVLIADGDRVLLGRRGPGSFAPDRWCLPGGFIEFEEDWVTAAMREVREETGFEVAPRAVINVCTNYLSPSLHTLVIVLRAEVVGGRAAPGDDLVELHWAPAAGPLPDMAFKADRFIVEHWAAGQVVELPIGAAEAGRPDRP